MIATFHIDFTDVSSTLHRLGSFFAVKTGRAFWTASYAKFVPAIKQQIKVNKSVFRGELHQRIGAKVEIFSDRVEISTGAHGVPYGLAVEEGTPARSIDSTEARKILEYVQKKMGVRGPGAFRVAGSIIMAIEDHGNIPHPYIMPAFFATKDILVADAIARLKKALLVP